MKFNSNIAEAVEAKTACAHFTQGSQATSKCHEH